MSQQDKVRDVYADLMLHDSDIVDEQGNSLILRKVTTFIDLPVPGLQDGFVYLVLDEDTIYEWDATTNKYIPFGGVILSYVSAKSTSYQNISKNANVKLTFNTTNANTLGEWNTSRFTAKTKKCVLLYAETTLNVNASGYLAIYKNGSLFSRQNITTSNFVSVNKTLELNANDYVEVYMNLTSTVTTASPYSSIIINELPLKGGK